MFYYAMPVINMPAFRAVSYIREDTDLRVLLLYHAEVPKCNALYFCSDKVKSYRLQYQGPQGPQAGAW